MRHGWGCSVVVVAVATGACSADDGESAVEGTAEFCNPLDREACDDEPSCLAVRGRIVVDGCPTDEERFVGCVAPTACEDESTRICDADGIPVHVGPNVCDLPPDIAQTCGPGPSPSACD